MAADENLLADVPLFALLDADERRALSNVLEGHKVSKGEMIFHMGDPGDCLYVIRSGKVEIFVKDHTGQKIVFTVAEHGDIFGELAIFDQGARSANALALEDCETLILDRDALLMFLRQKPDAGMDLLAVMAKRIRQTDEILRGRTSRNPNEEIQHELRWDQKFANFIAEYSGSMSFLIFNAGFFFLWIVLNEGWIPGVPAFDPYPFGLLTMAVSLEAIFLSIFVLLSQNVQSAKDRIRGDVEYEVNLKAELEIAELHDKFDIMNAKILERLHRLEKTNSSLSKSAPTN